MTWLYNFFPFFSKNGLFCVVLCRGPTCRTMCNTKQPHTVVRKYTEHTKHDKYQTKRERTKLLCTTGTTTTKAHWSILWMFEYFMKLAKILWSLSSSHCPSIIFYSSILNKLYFMKMHEFCVCCLKWTIWTDTSYKFTSSLRLFWGFFGWSIYVCTLTFVVWIFY